MSKTFSHAGVSRTGTTLKVRWCNGADRVKALIKDGQADIDIIELRNPMDKDAAVLHLLAIDFDNGNAEVRSVLEAEATKRGLEGYVVEKVRKPRAKKETAATTSDDELAAIEAAVIAAAVVTQLPVTDEAVVEDEPVEDNRIVLPAKELSMTPDAIRKREARARKAAEAAA